MARKKMSSLGQAARILGKRGGEKGGPARAAKLTYNERRAIASKGAKAANKKG
jgi:hypothetical protein